MKSKLFEAGFLAGGWLMICLVSYEYPPMKGGEGSYTYGLFSALSDLGEDVCVITGGVSKGSEQESNVIRVPVIERSPFGLFSFGLESRKAIKKLLNEKEIDLIHHTNDYQYLQRFDVPMVATAHHPYAAERRIVKENLSFSDYLHYSIYRRVGFVERMEKKICERADRIIAVSNYTAESINKEYNVSPEKITVIPDAVDTKRFNPSVDGNHIKERFDLQSDVILFVGRLDHTKGVQYLVEAFSMILKENPDAKLVIVGNGPMMRSLKNKKSIILAGSVSDTELPYFYAASDVVVLPSLMEGFGIVLLEAMATGKPCIAARAGGTEDVIEDGITGFFVPVADVRRLYDGIHTILSDGDLARKFGDAGRKRVEERFTWKKIAEKTMNIYRTI